MSEENWRDALPEDLRGNSVLEKYETAEAAVRGLVEAQTLIGKKGIIPPGENASQEEMDAFARAVTDHSAAIRPVLAPLPDTPEGYDLKMPENLPATVRGSEDMLKGFAATAHKAQLTKPQVDTLFSWFNEFETTRAANDDKLLADARKEGERILRDKWGDNYDAELGKAKAVINRFGNAEVVKALDAMGLSNDPGFIAFMHAIGGAISEDILHGDNDGRTALFTQALSREKLREMMQDPRYRDPTKRDPDFVKRVDEGYKALSEQGA